MMVVWGLIWRILVLQLGFWFLVGFFMGHKMPNMPAYVGSVSLLAAATLSHLWLRWSMGRRKRAQP